MFEPATLEKANGEFRLLICDGNDGRISTCHCIGNDIVLMLLPPHSSHLMQSLNVGVFFPLQQAMGGVHWSNVSNWNFEDREGAMV